MSRGDGPRAVLPRGLDRVMAVAEALPVRVIPRIDARRADRDDVVDVRCGVEAPRLGPRAPGVLSQERSSLALPARRLVDVPVLLALLVAARLELRRVLRATAADRAGVRAGARAGARSRDPRRHELASAPLHASAPRATRAPCALRDPSSNDRRVRPARTEGFASRKATIAATSAARSEDSPNRSRRLASRHPAGSVTPRPYARGRCNAPRRRTSRPGQPTWPCDGPFDRRGAG